MEWGAWDEEEQGINIWAHRKRAIHEEMLRGRELAYQLMVRSRSLGPPGSAHHDDLAAKILGSFTHTISILSSGDELSVSDVVLPAAAISISGRPSSSSDHRPDISRKSWCEDSNSTGPASNCKPPSLAASKLADRRGCYKRRKTSGETWTKETPTWIDDGHAWRKYGQKRILNAQHPRNYFRCTHKFDEDCRATKHVQKIRDNPLPLIRTTYHGRHTCKSLLKPPHDLLFYEYNSTATAAGDQDSSTALLLSFQLNHGGGGDVISSAPVHSCSATSAHSHVDFEMDTFDDDVLQFEF